MADPQTVNVGLIVPLTGADVDTWGSAALNPDFVAIDGMLGGVQGISFSNVPVILTAPAGFTPTPGAGPTQSQNRVLRLTGTLTADCTLQLPIPASYIIENFTTGNFDIIVRGVTATEIIAIPQGATVNVYNDGSRVRFVGLGKVGDMEHWAALSSMPSWVGKCTVVPYLLCDATVYNVVDFPYLGTKFLGKFGGNGVTTFANPDMRGRVPLAYDGTGTRITVAGCGINGQTLGAALDAQTVLLAANQIPSLTSSGNNTINVAGTISVFQATATYNTGTAPNPCVNGSSGPIPFSAAGNNNITVNYTNASQQRVNNVQPSIVTGIWVVKT